MSTISHTGEASLVHQHQIDALAEELALDPNLVADVYWDELEALERSARLKDFVPVFAARRSRDRLTRLRAGGHGGH